jgi:hypothetical protein
LLIIRMKLNKTFERFSKAESHKACLF